MSLAVNAQFNKFLEFAQSQANATSSKAVARIVEGEKGEKAPLAGRNITVANGDHAYSRDRTDAEKSANDKTREAFRKAIADMFGGEDAVITETHFGQDLTANIAQRANEA